MRICAAQYKSLIGDVTSNLAKHLEFINMAVSKNVDLIFFPELSLIGYEPKLADDLALDHNDACFDEIQIVSDNKEITVCIGIPSKSSKKRLKGRLKQTLISLVFIRPNKERQIYSKQLLHDDELPFFVPGKEQLLLECNNLVLVPAICFESVQISHANKAHELGANIYLASVAKSYSNVEIANKHYSRIAKQFGMTILMANSIGSCGDFSSEGASAIWDNAGNCVGKLDNESEGLIGIDTDTNEVISIFCESL